MIRDNDTDRDGERRKDEKLALLEERRSIYVNKGRRALLERLLEAGTATADDVYEAVELPLEVDARCLGAVPGTLARVGIIEADGFVKSNRPERHGSYIQRWRLADREAAMEWLINHPDQPNPTPTSNDDPDNWLFDPDPSLASLLKSSPDGRMSGQDGARSTNRDREGV